MQTFLFCTSYIDETDPSNNLMRYRRWVDFYMKRLTQLQAQYLIMIDDGSRLEDLELGCDFEVLDPFSLPAKLTNTVNIIHFPTHLGRPAYKDYRGWWRSFLYAGRFGNHYGFDKAVHIESDFFIVSERMFDYLRDEPGDWTAFYSAYHTFPESAIQIMNSQTFSKLDELYSNGEAQAFSFNKAAELFLPFTKVEKRFTGDRLGQFDVFDGWSKFMDMPCKLDYIGQVHPLAQPGDYDLYFEFEYQW